MADLASELVKLEELEHVPRISMHEGHHPADPNALLVETLAMCMCSGCSGGFRRWLDKEEGAFFHAIDDEGDQCDASEMLRAALEIGVPKKTAIQTIEGGLKMVRTALGETSNG